MSWFIAIFTFDTEDVIFQLFCCVADSVGHYEYELEMLSRDFVTRFEHDNLWAELNDKIVSLEAEKATLLSSETALKEKFDSVTAKVFELEHEKAELSNKLSFNEDELKEIKASCDNKVHEAAQAGVKSMTTLYGPALVRAQAYIADNKELLAKMLLFA